MRDTRRTPPRGSSAEARETPGSTRRPEGRKTRSRWDPDVARSNPTTASSIFFRARGGASGDAGTRASGNAGAGASGNASDPSKATRSSHHARARRRRRRAGVSARDDPNAAAEASVITTRGVRRLGDGASRGASFRAPRASTGETTEPGASTRRRARRVRRRARRSTRSTRSIEAPRWIDRDGSTAGSGCSRLPGSRLLGSRPRPRPPRVESAGRAAENQTPSPPTIVPSRRSKRRGTPPCARGAPVWWPPPAPPR